MVLKGELTPDQQRRSWSIRLVRSLWRENQALKRQLRVGQITPVGQTRRGSLAEAGTNVLVGFGLSVGANLLVLPEFGYAPGLQEATEIGAIFTGLSLARSYLLRRMFNGKTYAPTNKR